MNLRGTINATPKPRDYGHNSLRPFDKKRRSEAALSI